MCWKDLPEITHAIRLIDNCDLLLNIVANDLKIRIASVSVGAGHIMVISKQLTENNRTVER